MFTVLVYRDKIVIGTVAEAVKQMLINLSLGFKTALGSHTSLEHSKLGHKPRMLKGNPHPKPPVGPLQAHLALVLCIYRMLD